MTHPALTDADLSVEIVLTHADDERTETRGAIGFRPEVDSLGESGWQAWCPTPDSESRVVSLRATRADASGIVDFFTVLYAERTAGPLYSALEPYDSTRYQICPEALTGPADFDPIDFDGRDFATVPEPDD